MPRFFAYVDYFDEHPPLHLVVAAFAGVKPRRRRLPLSVGDTQTEQAGSDTAEMFAAMISSQWAGAGARA